jgi:hypothetical protein
VIGIYCIFLLCIVFLWLCCICGEVVWIGCGGVRVGGLRGRGVGDGLHGGVEPGNANSVDCKFQQENKKNNRCKNL